MFSCPSALIAELLGFSFVRLYVSSYTLQAMTVQTERKIRITPFLCLKNYPRRATVRSTPSKFNTSGDKALE